MRVATWNLLWRFGDWEPRQRLIDDALLAQSADVVLLQETWPAQADRLATLLGLEMLTFGGGYFDQKLSNVPVDAQFGNAVLCRSDLGASVVHDQPFDAPGDPAPRALLAIRVSDPASDELVIATSHLSHMGDAHDLRAEQFRHVAAVLDGLSSPAVFCGDHNLVPSSPEHAVAEELGFIDEWLAAHPDPSVAPDGGVDEFGATMNPDNPEISFAGWMDDRNDGNAPAGSGIRLDYVWTRAGRDALAPQVADLARFGRGEGKRWPSDHLGLVFDVA